MISQRQLFQQFLAPTSEQPLAIEIDRAEGIYLYGPGGKKYLDLISGIAVSNLGHSHPAVIKAVNEQMKKYTHLMVYGEMIQAPQVKLAQALALHLPERLQSVYFVNSGSEATEGAIKLAKRYTGRSTVISFEKAYHGSTQGALGVIGDESYRQPFRPLIPGHRYLPFNDMEALDAIDEHCACVIAETVQAEAGVRIPAKEYMQALRKKCSETGALLILDEVQAGMGRTGKLFAFEHYDIAPDILTLAKAFGGGLPLGAFIASPEVMKSLSFNPALGHITTFGGNAVSCAAGLAAFEFLVEEKIFEKAETKAQLFRSSLKSPAIVEIRNLGLMMAIDLGETDFCQSVIAKCIERGLFLDWFLFADHCIRISPPLIISEEEIRTACKLLTEIIDETV